MDTAILFKGLALGFLIAAPIGPIGILCIRRTLSAGVASGFVFGLGTATADAMYSALAVCGITVAAGFLLDYQLYLRLAGGAFLCYLGTTTFRAEPVVRTSQTQSKNLLGAYGAAFILTVANPMTIVAFAAVFAGMSLSAADFSAGALLVAGVFAGSALWWLVLSGATGFLCEKMNHRRMKTVNRLAGIIIFGFGLFCLFGL